MPTILPNPLAPERPLTARERRIIEDITRREFVIGGTTLAALFAAGCSSDDSGSDEAGETRQVTDLYGRTLTIPANPQRIVTIDFSGPSVYLTELGLDVIGGTDYASDPATLPREFVDGRSFERIGTLEAVNFEALAALNPDLIVAYTYTRDQFEPAEEFAPVLGFTDDVLDKLPPGPFGILRWLGEMLDRTEQAADIERRALESMEQFEPLRGRRVAFINAVNFAAPTNVYFYGSNDIVGRFLQPLGATWTPDSIDNVPLTDNGVEVSLELVPDLLADTEIVIVLAYGLYAEEVDSIGFLEQLQANPIWSAVPAIQRGDVAYVEFETATFNWGSKGLQVLLEQITEQLSN